MLRSIFIRSLRVSSVDFVTPHRLLNKQLSVFFLMGTKLLSPTTIIIRQNRKLISLTTRCQKRRLRVSEYRHMTSYPPSHTAYVELTKL